MAEITIAPEFKANLILRGKIECLTGLHIGGSKEKMEIGGVDSIVVRSANTDYPYIPGSSLKGKMRHLLEYITGAVAHPVEGQLGQVSVTEDIVRMFGIGADIKQAANDEKELKKIKDEAFRDNVKRLKNIGLTRLIVRDALPDEETKKMWDNLGSDANYTEYKAENTIDRLTSAANPRFIERVVEGSKFNFEMVYTAYDLNGDTAAAVNKDLKHILAGLRLLESSAIGKSGSRGYGKIAFLLEEPIWISAEAYLEGNGQWKNSRQVDTDPKLKLEDITEIKFPG